MSLRATAASVVLRAGAWLRGKSVHRKAGDTNNRGTLDNATLARAKSALRSAAQGMLNQLADVYDLMLATDTHILGCKRQLLFGFLTVPYSVKSGKEGDPVADAAAKLCRDITESSTARFGKVLAGIVEGDLRGVNVTEIIWPEEYARPHVPCGYSIVHQQRVKLDAETGAVRIILDDDDFNGTPLSDFPAGKWLVVTPNENVPDFSLRGVLRAVVNEWLDRLSAAGWEMIALQRWGMPIPFGKYANDDDRVALETAFSNFGAGGSLIATTGTEVTMFGNDSKGSLAHEELRAKSAQRISVAFLGNEQSVTVGADQGSQASAKSQRLVTKDVLYGLWETACEVVGRDLFAPVVRINFGPGVPTPKLIPNFDEPMDLAAAASALAILAELWDVPVSWGRKLTGAPEMQPGDVAMTPPAAKAAPLGFPGAARTVRRFLASLSSPERPLPVRPEGLNGAQFTDPVEAELAGVASTSDLHALATHLNGLIPERSEALEDAAAAEILNAFLSGAAGNHREEN